MGHAKIKYISTLFSFLCFFFLLGSHVNAVFLQSYQDYIFQFNRYRDAHQEYQVSKSKYQSFQTLTSQIEAQTKTKIVLEARTDTLSAYIKALKDKLTETKAVSQEDLNANLETIKQQLLFLNANKTKISGAANISDLKLLNDEFKSIFPQITDETNQTLATISFSKLNYFFQIFDSQKALLDDFVRQKRSDGINTENWERQILTAEGKRRLASDKYTAAKINFFPKDSYNQLNITTGNTNLKESFQYVKDAISYLLETEKVIRGE